MTCRRAVGVLGWLAVLMATRAEAWTVRARWTEVAGSGSYLVRVVAALGEQRTTCPTTGCSAGICSCDVPLAAGTEGDLLVAVAAIVGGVQGPWSNTLGATIPTTTTSTSTTTSTTTTTSTVTSTTLTTTTVTTSTSTSSTTVTTSSTTVPTTTLPTTTTTTLAGTWSRTDDFNRANLGSTWAQVAWDQGTLATNGAAVAAMGGNQESLAFYAPAKPVGDGWACAQLQVEVGASNDDAQVCLGMAPTATAGKLGAVCCGNDAATNTTVSLVTFPCDGSACRWTPPLTMGGIAAPLQTGDAIGIERVGDAVRCLVQRAGTTTWTAAASGTVGAAQLQDTYAGLYTWADSTTAIYRLDAFGVGGGSIAGRSCGAVTTTTLPSTTTTTTTTSTTTSTIGAPVLLDLEILVDGVLRALPGGVVAGHEVRPVIRNDARQ